jgi:DNA modification methylase
MIDLRCGDCLELLPSLQAQSVDLIVTDPPYPKQYDYLYGKMAKEAKRVLRIGGSLVTLCGHYQLPKVLNDICEHLRYRWIVKLDHPGSHARMAMGIMVTWKPMLWFVNEKLSPRRNITDGCASQKRSKESGHPWQQDLDYALWAIESLTDAGDTVLDPFMGSGTTGVACVNTGRNFIGFDKMPEYVKIAQRRIADAQPALTP